MNGSVFKNFADFFENINIGDAENDTLTGSENDDRLRGGAGDDLLNGGLGDDVLRGGRGTDTFVIGLGDGNDTIRDFDVSEIGDSSDTGIISFDDITFEDSEDGVIATLADGQTLTFRDLAAADLTADKLTFAEDDAGAEIDPDAEADPEEEAEDPADDDDGDDGDADDAGIIAGTAGDDSLVGTEASDTFILDV